MEKNKYRIMTSNYKPLVLKTTFLLYLVFVFLSNLGISQEKQNESLKVIDSLISVEQFSEALQITRLTVETLLEQKQYYETTDYVYYLGKINTQIKNTEEGEKAVLNFSERLQSLTQNPKVLRQLHIKIGQFYYQEMGDFEASINHNLTALDESHKIPSENGELIGEVYGNLGMLNNYSGNIVKGTAYHKKALSAYQNDKNTPKRRYFMTYNSLGGAMWYASKIDSALYYYKKAESIVPQLEPTPENTYLKPARLYNNMHSLYVVLGDTEKALYSIKHSISLFNTYLDKATSEVHKTAARENLFMAIENYAALCKDFGNYQKAKELLTYSYQQKQKYLEADNPEISNGKILLGQIYLALKDFKEANRFLTEGISYYENINKNNLWLADAYMYQANLYWETGKIELAKSYFEKSEHYYKKALGDYYDQIYLSFIVNASKFYAENGYSDKAEKLSQKAYNYIVENQGRKTLLEYYQTLNLAEIASILKNYPKALSKSIEALNLLNDSTFVHNNDLGKLQILAKKPAAILIKVKSELQLHDQNDIDFIQKKYKELQDAVAIIEQKKTLLTHDSGVSILITSNNEVFEFTKILALKLYQATNNSVYLDDLLSLNESLLYNKIRARLKAHASMSFENIPKKLIEEEQRLKTILNAPVENTNAVDTLIKAQSDWDALMKTIKKEYPKYHTLKYASISKSLPDLSSKIKENTTVIRYTFINEDLYAFVISDAGKKLIPLNANGLDTLVSQHRNTDNFSQFNTLYDRLWKPLETYVTTEKVVIIPDRILFNVSFELLAPKLVDNVNDLATFGLLSKHVISYHYSLFLLGENSKTIGYNKSFVAFAPEFNDAMKKDYRIAISDSLAIDKTYLKLLQQPFSSRLAKEYAKLFDGTYFANKKASKSIFLANANEHKIIHIGTHAESNNVSPQLSRLIFAKNTALDDDNSLYTYEIYNQNLNANLAVLTACETGKPTYQAGEGMISLAHAFNYAGSESILTSLWEIDEQSSTQIVKLFYDNLAKGLYKDKALQQAKLSYIKNAVGATITPQYWAGLVLIGDTAPINIEKSNSVWWIVIAITAIVLLIGYYIKYHKS